MNKISILLVGKTDHRCIEELCDDYAKRIQRYVRFETIIIPDLKASKNLSIEEQKREEGKAILSRIQENDYVVLLDEKGKAYRSVELSDWLQSQLSSTYKRLLLIVGGPYGFSNDVYAIAQEKLSLSKLTMTHQMIRVLLSEQIYRAFTIIHHLPYHHE